MIKGEEDERKIRVDLLWFQNTKLCGFIFSFWWISTLIKKMILAKSSNSRLERF